MSVAGVPAVKGCGAVELTELGGEETELHPPPRHTHSF